MLKNVLLLLGGYLLYKLIKRSVRGFRREAQAQQQGQSHAKAQSADQVKKKKPDLDKVGEYVEFEEIDKSSN